MKPFTLIAYDQKWQVKIEDHAKIEKGGGCFDPDTRTIYITTTQNHKGQISTLLHEIIHLIEYYWHFELGNHQVFKELEIAGLLEEDIIKILRENKLRL